MKFNPVFADTPSGSLAGITASRNRFGSYFRMKAVPVNPNSTRQQAIRSIFGTAVQAWTETLTAAQRAGWETYAENVPFLDSLGNSINLTGQQAFLRTTIARLNIGGAIIAAAPTIMNTGAPPTDIQGNTSSNSNEIEIVSGALATNILINGTASDDGDLVLQLGPPINASRNFFKGPYQKAVVGAVPGSTPSVALTDSQPLAQADGLVAGQFRSARVRICYDDGRLTEAYEALCNVVDTTP